MRTPDQTSTRYSRRAFGKIALAGLPASWALGTLPLAAFAKINSKINGVQLGSITYSFRTIPSADDIIKAYVQFGIGEMELMSNHAEALAGAPQPAGRGGAAGAGRQAGSPPAAAGTGGAAAGAAPTGAAPGGPPMAGSGAGAPAMAGPPPQGRQGGGRAPLTPEQMAARDAAAKALHDWRMSASERTFAPVRKKIEDAGIDLRLLCYNMNVASTQDDEIEYAFMMAKWLGVKGITTSTQVSMAKRIAPFADKHKMLVGFHGHANTANPDEVATPATFATVMAASKYHAANLDIGHFTEAGYDSVKFIEENHARITNLHLKDKKTAANGGQNTPWGGGDTPIKPVLKLLQARKWDIPANIEFEYPGDPMVEVPKCLQYAKDILLAP